MLKGHGNTVHYFKNFSFIEQDTNAQSLSFYCKEGISCVDEGILNELKKIAVEEERSVRICLHNSLEADLHNMLICQHINTYIRPHKHLSKSETYHIIEGEIALFIFNDEGEVIERFDMSPQKKVLCRIERNYYHTLIPITKHVIFHESRPGPFLKENDSFFPPWSISPDEKDKIAHFISTIIKLKKQ